MSPHSKIAIQGLQGGGRFRKTGTTLVAACVLSLCHLSTGLAQTLESNKTLSGDVQLDTSAMGDASFLDTGIIIDVPELVIVGQPELKDIIIEVPELVIVGEPEEDDETTPADKRLTQIGIDTGTNTPTTTAPAPSEDVTTKQKPQDWCIGEFDAHFGRGKGTAVGFARPFGKYSIVGAQVRPVGCRAALDVRIQGQPIALSQTGGAGTYSGKINLGDGAARTLVLTCNEDLNLRGYLEAKDANLRITRPVWFLRKQGSSAALLDCDDPRP